MATSTWLHAAARSPIVFNKVPSRSKTTNFTAIDTKFDTKIIKHDKTSEKFADNTSFLCFGIPFDKKDVVRGDADRKTV